MTEPSGGDLLPVTVIGGYLGAGKTTLLNHLLASTTERMAVLVNDFGEINIDALLITRHDGDTIELANGCVCCSLVDGLAAALERVSSLDPRPDRLVIEASGVADPAGVAAYAYGPGLTLDAVVVVVDGETVEERAADGYVGDTVTGQLDAADLLVLNKRDLLDEPSAERVNLWLKAGRSAAVVEATAAAVAPSIVLGPRRAGAGEEPRSGAGGHHVDFASWSWESDRSLEEEAVERLMAARPEGVLRVKGLLAIGPERRWHELHGVGRRWSLRPVMAAGQPRPGSAVDRSRLVAIGIPGAIDDDWLSSRLR